MIAQMTPKLLGYTRYIAVVAARVCTSGQTVALYAGVTRRPPPYVPHARRTVESACGEIWDNQWLGILPRITIG